MKKQLSKTWSTLASLLVFSIAMGYLETSVVVYLRKMYYPTGEFPFPLVPISGEIAVVEFWREAATILMLAGAGMLAGKNALQRFAYFLFCFAVWDIFYYIFLKVLIAWPVTLLDWDILFLIPIPWTGPVLAPCIVALTMIVFALCIVIPAGNGVNVKVKRSEWLMMLAGCLVILASFMQDYAIHVMNQSGSGFWTLSSAERLFEEAKNFRQTEFAWGTFVIGELLIAAGIARIIYRNPLTASLTTNRTAQYDQVA